LRSYNAGEALGSEIARLAAGVRKVCRSQGHGGVQGDLVVRAPRSSRRKSEGRPTFRKVLRTAAQRPNLADAVDKDFNLAPHGSAPRGPVALLRVVGAIDLFVEGFGVERAGGSGGAGDG